jgi:AcrR family transcriptional regulator
MTGARAQQRAEMISEIKRLARAQIAAEGASNLSLRAIARDIGVASSALYRYYDTRDQLLTDLIVETYDEIGKVVEAADARMRRDDLRGRWLAISRSLRSWALAHPSDFGLVFGTPVPGYVAPADTIGPATRYTTVLLRLLADIENAGCDPTNDSPVAKNLSRQYAGLRKRFGYDISDHHMRAGLSAWMNLIGTVSFEVFGQFDNVFAHPTDHFNANVDFIATSVLGI